MKPSFFIRKDIYKTGIPDLDREYVDFLGILDDLFLKVINNIEQDQIKYIIRKLKICSRNLFSVEQKYIDILKLGDIEKNLYQSEQKTFINHLDRLYTYNKSDNVQNYIFIDFVRQWIIDHLLVSDKKLAVCLKNSVIYSA